MSTNTRLAKLEDQNGRGSLCPHAGITYDLPDENTPKSDGEICPECGVPFLVRVNIRASEEGSNEY